MALALSAIRQAMAQTLEAAYGSEVQVATAPDQITPPCLMIGMASVTYHESAQRGVDSCEWSLWAILPRISDQAAVDLADEWASSSGDRSLAVVLEDDQTLGGACQTLVVRSAVMEIWSSAMGDLPAIRWTIGVWG